MAAGAESDDRTEAASARRLQRARDDGQVAVSPELSAMFLLSGAAGLLLLRVPGDLRQLCGSLAALLSSAGGLDGRAEVGQAVCSAARAGALSLLALFGVAVAAGMAATLLQTGFLFNVNALLPDLARLDPRRGLHRVFGAGNLRQAGKSLLKLAIIGFALWRLFRQRRETLVAALMQDPASLPGTLFDLGSSILLTTLAAQAAIALLDVVFARLRHTRSLRMSRFELREEAREADGNSQVKAKLRRLRAQRARHRMAQAVQQATVVVTNPTHYAVALAYDRTRGAAPRVVAKGVDEMAARIRAIAEAHRVPMVANPPLARALHRVELDSDIPPEHYQAVAELIAYVWRLQGLARRPAAQP